MEKILYSPQAPWIAERETILCTWKPDYDRGFINNMNMNMAVDIYGFSRRQLHDYVRMLKAFGYTGMQITDGCSSWVACGGWERFHDIMKDLAVYLHEEGMQFSLWVWAAQFNGHGWHDDDVCYTPAPGLSAWEDPRVRACFEKYYDIYADMAPYCDRLLLHFFDPGSLGSYDDVFRYAGLIRDKFLAINPSVTFGIDTWGCPPDYPQRLAEAGFRGSLLLELPFLPTWGVPGKRAAFRESVKAAGCECGVWSWYTADLEIDQTAAMVVNARVVKDVYNRTREQADTVAVPRYWSEIDSYHVLNLFSLYCAGQLLIDPERDPDELLCEIAHLVFGDGDGPAALRALRLIQDARSGDTWESYWWTEEDYVMTRTDPAFCADIAARAAASLDEMRAVASHRHIPSRIPLPVSAYVIANLMLPHLEQIKRYAEFRLTLGEWERMVAEGADKAMLSAAVEKAWEPVPDYNAIIGVWGQYECRLQTRMVRDFCVGAGIPVPERPLRRYAMKKRFYEYLISRARDAGETAVFPRNYYEVVDVFGDEYDEIIASLAADGLIVLTPEDGVALAQPDAYKYHFSAE